VDAFDLVQRANRWVRRHAEVNTILNIGGSSRLLAPVEREPHPLRRRPLGPLVDVHLLILHDDALGSATGVRK
jgi:hypothetical protein